MVRLFYRIILLRVNPIQVFGYIRESIFAVEHGGLSHFSRVNPIQVFGYIRRCTGGNVYRIILLRVSPIQVFGDIRESILTCSICYNFYRIILLRVNPIQVFGYIRGQFLRVKFTELFFCVSTPYKFSGILGDSFCVSSLPNYSFACQPHTSFRVY